MRRLKSVHECGTPYFAGVQQRCSVLPSGPTCFTAEFFIDPYCHALCRSEKTIVWCYWLIWARNVATGEEKYFLSNASADAKLQTLVRVAFRRWNVEHAFRVGKSELGFTHYEGRNYTGLMRHQTLCLLMLTFVAGHTERLRGETSGGDA